LPWQLTTLPTGRALAFTRGIATNRSLATILGDREIISWPRTPWRPRENDFVVGWGRKRNTFWARRYAARHHLPFISLEDGYLRSVGLGKAGSPSYSFVLDDFGTYYDCSSTNRLEAWLNSPKPVPEEARTTVDSALTRIRDLGLTKYNGLPRLPLDRFEPDREHVLVVDQVAGDLSLRHGGAESLKLADMVQAAHQDHPDAVIWIKAHPDSAAGYGRGLNNDDIASARFITELCDPIALLEPFCHIYVGTSLLGFEAVLRNLPVTCFGQPFYSGWGFTDDRLSPDRRDRRRSADEVFAAAYVGYSHYVDLETGQSCGTIMSTWRRGNPAGSMTPLIPLSDK